MENNTEDVTKPLEEKKTRWQERQEKHHQRWEEKIDSWEKRKSHGGNIVFAALLIFLGLLFLGNNLGILPWYVWSTIWRFWPIFLILLGLQILLGRSLISRIIISLLTLGIIGALFYYVLAVNGIIPGTTLRRTVPFMPTMDNDDIQQNVNNDVFFLKSDIYKNISARNMSIDAGIGKLILHDTDSPDYLIMNSEYPAGFAKPAISTIDSNGTLDINIKLPGNGNFMRMPMMRNVFTYDAAVGRRDIPTRFDIHVGAGEATVNLSEIKVSSLSADVGGGSTDIAIQEKSVPTDSLNVKVGVGAMTLTLPKNVGLDIHYSIGLGALNVNGNSLHGDDEYKSDSYQTALKKLTITASIGTGSMTIVQE